MWHFAIQVSEKSGIHSKVGCEDLGDLQPYWFYDTPRDWRKRLVSRREGSRAEQGSLLAGFSARKLPAAVCSYDAYRAKLFCASLVNKPGWILKIFRTVASATLQKGYNKTPQILVMCSSQKAMLISILTNSPLPRSTPSYLHEIWHDL